MFLTPWLSVPLPLRGDDTGPRIAKGSGPRETLLSLLAGGVIALIIRTDRGPGAPCPLPSSDRCVTGTGFPGSGPRGPGGWVCLGWSECLYEPPTARQRGPGVFAHPASLAGITYPGF